jgi:hypothetical protein
VVMELICSIIHEMMETLLLVMDVMQLVILSLGGIASMEPEIGMMNVGTGTTTQPLSVLP